MKINDHKSPPPTAAVQTADSQVMVENGVTLSRTNVTTTSNTKIRKRAAGEVVYFLLRLLSLAASVIAIVVMITAHQYGSISFYGFQLPLDSKWSYSYSYVYVVGATAATAGYSLLQLLVVGSRLLTKSPVIPSKYQAWLFFAGDQIFGHVMMSAGSAAAGVTNLNRTGIRHTALPDFCKAVSIFCDHVAISVVFTFFCGVLLAASAVQDVIWLTKHSN